MPPRSGLSTMAARILTFRVRGVGASSSVRSQAVATSMLNRQVSGAPGSVPPRMPVASSLAASKRWA
jgi:hypothetical protein